jgi:hypothetical protein
VLDLDRDDNIKGGRYYSDSGQIDMLWAPLKPAQGGDEKNKRGNPHLNVKEVLAIWRDSVPEDLRKQWLNIDPTEEDRILPPEALATTEQPVDATELSASGTSAVATDVASGGGEAEAATGEAGSGSAEAPPGGGEAIAAAPGNTNRDGQLDAVPPSGAPMP